ncbi:type II toxin-antitoxin system HicB family antitoxin [Streptomyces malaysiensis]|uniref:HicB family protein n=1 Tax=Streptomyces autolyticus TaxID=75293 RepID=A0ABM6HGF3_9ACTN|nr:type II toxin-antitoxin system HicB family antitoxin [Streptomyces autolyticus]AQA13018.1 HicB family protein [Streptomyces autolyticus]
MTEYSATARYDGKWWSVSFDDLPEGYGGATQGRTWAEAERMAREAVALLLDVEKDSFELVMRPADPAMAAAIVEAERTKEEAEQAAVRARKALVVAAVELTKKVTVRDAGAMLHVSHQQIAKLAPKAS